MHICPTKVNMLYTHNYTTGTLYVEFMDFMQNFQIISYTKESQSSK
jgi:hypothetical protein